MASNANVNDGNNHVLPTAPPEEEKLVRHMPYEAHACLSRLLRPHNSLGNYWKRLAGELGFTLEEINDLNEERDPVLVLLRKLPDLTISKLKICLTKMERPDVLEELEGFEAKTLLPSDYKKRQEVRGANSNGPPPFTTLPNDERYDAFLCYAKEDIEFAKEILKNMESAPYHLNLCIDYRDILPGGDNLETLAHVIEQRCLRIVAILTEDFNNDETADFQAKIALSLSPGCRQKRLIPIKYKPCAIPTIYRFITHLDYTNEHSRKYLWIKLAKALGYQTN